MFVTTETPNSPHRVALFAEIPLMMTELELQRTFEQPLRKWLTENGIGFSLRCFPLPQRQDRALGIGIEVQANDISTLALAVEQIIKLGAPPETRVEIENDDATIEMTLAEARGR